MWSEPTKKELRAIRREFVIMYPFPKTRTRLTVDAFLAGSLCRRCRYMSRDADFNRIVTLWALSQNTTWEKVVLWAFDFKKKIHKLQKIRASF